MPMYALECKDCGNKEKELVCTVREREALTCSKCGGAGLHNDYSRHATSNFQLKGSDWPSKEMRLGNKILRERNLD